MNKQQKNQSPNRTTILNQQTTTLLANIIDQDPIPNIKDTLISIQYRIKTLENQINHKMEREECLTLIERKSNISYVKKCFEELYSKIQLDRTKDQQILQKMQQQQKVKISQLKKKLKQINNTKQITQISTLTKDITLQNVTKKINKVFVKPQQLYLQSNQTMFSMLIDQIKQLKQKDTLIQRLIESKHKKTVSLNNQVCRKLEHLQNEIQQTIKYIDKFKSNVIDGQQAQTKKLNKKNSTKAIEKPVVYSQSNNSQNEAFQMIRLQLLSKSVQSIQKQLAQKLNIKDFIPLIKQHLPSFQQNIQQIKSYVQQNFQSMHKILINQSEINEQISKANKLAWWHCYDKVKPQISENQQQMTSSRNYESAQYILFNKQIMNIIPESLAVQEGEQQTLKVLTKGWYLVHIYGLNAYEEEGEEFKSNRNRNMALLEINNGPQQLINDKKLLNLSAGSELRILTKSQDLFVQVQKL